MREWGAELFYGQIRQALPGQMITGLAHGGRHLKPQSRQQLVGIDSIGGVRRATVQQRANTLICQQYGGEQIPRMVLLLARVTGPVQLNGRKVLQCLITHAPAGIQKSRQFIRGFFLDP